MDGCNNPLKSIVGISGNDSEIVQMMKAGQSTSIGFLAIQSTLNVANDKDKNWLD